VSSPILEEALHPPAAGLALSGRAERVSTPAGRIARRAAVALAAAAAGFLSILIVVSVVLWAWADRARRPRRLALAIAALLLAAVGLDVF
jgi:hypothetical protein